MTTPRQNTDPGWQPGSEAATVARTIRGRRFAIRSVSGTRHELYVEDRFMRALGSIERAKRRALQLADWWAGTSDP